MKVTKLFHCCFLIETKNTKVLIDPALSFFGEEEKYKDYNFDYILVSHAHFDHFDDAISLSEKTGAELVSVMSIKNYVNKNFPQVKTSGFQPGGTLMLGDLKVKVFQAMHESFLRDGQPLGLACYFAFDDGENTLAYLADSAFNPTYYDVELLMGKPMDNIIVNVGTVSTLNCDDAFIISKNIFKNATTIPAHYELWKDDINILDMKKRYEENNLNIKIVDNYSQVF